MLRIATKTKLTPGEAIRQAVEFFGPDGYQLEIKDKAPACAEFEGGGGGVQVTACLDEEGTSVELISREWDHQVKEFVGKIAS